MITQLLNTVNKKISTVNITHSINPEPILLVKTKLKLVIFQT